jgi:carboxypeptidase C (cathepsin A)
LEKGIFNISGDLDKPSEIKLRALEDGWHSFTKVLMVDQPLGTGYSTGQQKFYAKDVNQATFYLF